ncbi:MAG TPA: hypothetical protein VLT45_11900 [Kofleriaceae bacterium]|nr:hypothetical protein [Kofleriaceae bacterium]
MKNVYPENYCSGGTMLTYSGSPRQSLMSLLTAWQPVMCGTDGRRPGWSP